MIFCVLIVAGLVSEALGSTVLVSVSPFSCVNSLSAIVESSSTVVESSWTGSWAGTAVTTGSSKLKWNPSILIIFLTINNKTILIINTKIDKVACSASYGTK